MKKLLFSLFIATLIVVGCKKEEITLLDISDFAVHVGGQGQNTAGNIAIDDYVTFVDLSRNSTEHSWTISNGSAFISDKFSDADSEQPSEEHNSIEEFMRYTNDLCVSVDIIAYLRERGYDVIYFINIRMLDCTIVQQKLLTSSNLSIFSNLI